ncbi:MAG TPA: serine protease, partial [Bacteroidales bacterium]|nr:serine protease [Bacteroidales bacterium]
MGSILLAEQAVTVKKRNLPEKVSKVYIIEMKEEIAPPMRRKVQKGLREARENGADLIIIHMNTYGGTLDAADSIRTMILTSSLPVWVFIDNNAASAGALISIACDSIYMRPGANIGAATVVDQTGGALPDKYQSYMRSMMRSTAEAKGRDPQIAQAMVDTRIVVPGIDDSTTVITFTTSEAIKYGFCEGESENIQEILQKYGWDDAIIITQKLSGVDKIINFLINPIISAILIMMIIGGIYFELQTPG